MKSKQPKTEILRTRVSPEEREQISAKALKQQMNKWRYTLEEHGVYFLSHRSNGERILEVKFVPPFSDASAVSDAENGSAKSCAPCVPCVTDGSVIR